MSYTFVYEYFYFCCYWNCIFILDNRFRVVYIMWENLSWINIYQISRNAKYSDTLLLQTIMSLPTKLHRIPNSFSCLPEILVSVLKWSHGVDNITLVSPLRGPLALFYYDCCKFFWTWFLLFLTHYVFWMDTECANSILLTSLEI